MFKDVLCAELDRRQAVNARYSVRSYARALSINHSTLSQVLRGKRRITPRSVRALGPRIGLSQTRIAGYCGLENEAAVVRALASSRCRPNSRWFASATGLPVDDVNVALQSLLRKRVLVMASGHWLCRTPES